MKRKTKDDIKNENVIARYAELDEGLLASSPIREFARSSSEQDDGTKERLRYYTFRGRNLVPCVLVTLEILSSKSPRRFTRESKAQIDQRDIFNLLFSTNCAVLLTRSLLGCREFINSTYQVYRPLLYRAAVLKHGRINITAEQLKDH